MSPAFGTTIKSSGNPASAGFSFLIFPARYRENLEQRTSTPCLILSTNNVPPKTGLAGNSLLTHSFAQQVLWLKD